MKSSSWNDKPYLRRNLIYVIPKVPTKSTAATSKKKRKEGYSSSRHFFVHLIDRTGPYPSNRTVTKPKRCKDPVCLFCKFDAKSLAGLWAHFHSDHDDEFEFTHRITTDNTIHILATKRRHCDSNGKIEFQKVETRRKRKAASLVQLKWKPIIPIKKKEESCLLFSFDFFFNGDPSTMQITPPKRIEWGDYIPVPRPELSMDMPIKKYFHSQSLQPYNIGDWLADVESEDESDETWRRLIAEKQLDEFDDVSHPEKLFFNLWNCFIQNIPLATEKELPRICCRFTEQYANKLHHQKLEEQLILHLTNLWDEGQIGKTHLCQCMARYHDLISASDNRA